MQRDESEQSQADDPEQLPERLKEVRVTIQRLRPQEQLEVADHVPGDKEEETGAAGRHEVFLPHRGIQNPQQTAHSILVSFQELDWPDTKAAALRTIISPESTRQPDALR